MNVVLDILKATVPALIVFATVYYMMKQWLEAQVRKQMLDSKQNQLHITLPLRLQAYERLAMLTERISITNLVFRLRSERMSGMDLRNAMMMAIQQEYEHNIAQQVYVSGNLWQIIKLAKDNILAIITNVYETMPANADSLDLANALFRFMETQTASAIETAQEAIRAEAGSVLN